MNKLFVYCPKINFLDNIENVVPLEEMDGKRNIKQ